MQSVSSQSQATQVESMPSRFPAFLCILGLLGGNTDKRFTVESPIGPTLPPRYILTLLTLLHLENNTMDSAAKNETENETEDEELKLIKASAGLLADFEAELPKVLWKTIPSSPKRVHKHVTKHDLNRLVQLVCPDNVFL